MVHPTTDQPLVHLGLTVASQCRVPKWSSTEMAAVKYGLNIHHNICISYTTLETGIN